MKRHATKFHLRWVFSLRILFWLGFHSTSAKTPSLWKPVLTDKKVILTTRLARRRSVLYELLCLLHDYYGRRCFHIIR